jgi:hypothetical protein
MRSRAVRLAAVLALESAAALAAPVPGAGGAVEVPDPLRPWVGWVMAGKEQALCPFLEGQSGDGATRCAWPSSLTLELSEKGGRFTQSWAIYHKEWVALPGDAKAWPQEVRVDGKAAVVASQGDPPLPRVLLAPGQHTVAGTFLWDELPESLRVPEDTGLLQLTVRGTKLPLPSRDDDGRVLLEKGATKLEADVLEMTVHRRVTDGIPLELLTRIELRVSGRAREVVLGRALPDGFVPLSLESKIPARLEADGKLRVQVRPGTWQILLGARHDGPVAELQRPAPNGTWATDEAWAFDARPDLRVVTVEGVQAIDPQQTTIPDEWKKLPCYPMHAGDLLKLVEHRRGDAEPAPDRLTLRRDLWLDFDGTGYTVSDHLAGTLNRAWRLEVDWPTELGRVAVGGKDQFITRAGSGGKAGVEIRQGQVDVTADSRIDANRLGGLGELPAVSWASDFHQVEATLHLPPGWRLFHASGADDVPGTWLRSWTLLDLFLLLILAGATGRLFGWRWGALALAALTLALPEEDAPRWILLVVLGLEALARVLERHPGWMLRVVRITRVFARVALALVALSFAVTSVRHGIYPALEQADGGGDDFAFFGAKHAFELAVPMGAAAPTAVPEAPVPQAVDRPMGMADKGKLDADEKEESGRRSSGVIDQLLDGASSPGWSEGRSGKKVRSPSYKYAEEYDPNAMVQTGPGLPRWHWHDVALSFSGPVQHSQTLRLWLLSPPVNLALALVRVALTLALVVLLLGLRDRNPPWLRGGGAISAASAVGALAVFFTLGGSARADAPPPAPVSPPQPSQVSGSLLDELQKRLLAPPACRPHCATSPRLQLEVTPTVLRARMEVGVAAPSAVPLPGSASQWVPERVVVDGRPAGALARTDDGTLWLELAEGSHQVQLEGALPPRETVQIALPLKPHRVEARADGWQLAGLHEDGLADDDLQLTRVQRSAQPQAALQPGALPPFVRVERELQIGLEWQVDTKVVRVTPTGSAVVLEVPLLPGESVTTPEIRVQNGKALVNMGPSATEVSWHSLLQERSPILLEAPHSLPWTEVWRLDASPVWHVERGGIPVVHAEEGAGARRPEWRPWPGEQVKIDVTRPEGVVGRTLTIDHSALQLKPGLRATDAKLALSVRSSRGGQQVVTLPDGAVLQSLTVDGKNQPVRQDGRKVTLPLMPGAQSIELAWRAPQSIGARFQAPEVDLGAPSVNAEVQIELPYDRWTLAAGGPRLGPAVLFWSFLIVLALAALGLGRTRWAPLEARHWLLLGIGLSQVPLAAAAIPAGLLLALGVRRERPAAARWRFNLYQIVLIGWAVVAAIVLLVSIHEGLLGQPDMRIAGNGSTASCLRWFQDRADGALPRPWVLSAPLWLYRVAMLAWALWLARALLRWVRWAWSCFSFGALWRKAPPPTMKMPPPPPPPSHNPPPPPPAAAP